MESSKEIIKRNVKVSDLKYPIYLQVHGNCAFSANATSLNNVENYCLSNIMKRMSCLIAMNLNDDQKFTQQTQYLLASQLHSKLHINRIIAGSPKIDVNINGYTIFPIEDKQITASTGICRKEHIRYFIDDATSVVIAYDIKLVIGTFDEFRNQNIKSYPKVALLPILDDYLIKYFKDLQKQFASIGYFDLHDLSSFMGADIKLYKCPPLIGKLTAALEIQLKEDLNEVE